MLYSLEKLLQEAEKPGLTSQKKEAIKQKLFCRLAQHKERPLTMIELISRAVSGLSLGLERRARIKEKVFALIERHAQKRFFWGSFLFLHKKLVSLSLVVVMVFATMSFVNVDTAVVYAGGFTRLDSFSGQVFIERDGETVAAKFGMKILEKDKIVTAADAHAVISYFGESVTRLAGDTEVLVSKLKKDGFAENQVEVSLLGGTLWSRVAGLVGDQSSFVVKAEDVYAAAQRAAFNVKVTDDGLEIKVFNHEVEVKSGTSVEKVSRGKKVVVAADTKKIQPVQQIAPEEKDEEWVQQNLQSDKEYASVVEQNVLAAKMESVGMDGVDDKLPGAKSFREGTLLFLTFDYVKKEKMELDLAEKHFVAAQVKFHDPDLSEEERAEAQKAVEEFAKRGEKFSEVIGQVGVKDQVYAQELQTYLDEKILNHKKELSLVLPDSPLYQTKDVVDGLQLLAAESEVEVAEIKVEQVTEALSVVEDVVDGGDEALLEEVLADYQEEVSSVSEAVDSVEEGEVKEQLVQEMDVLMETFVEVSGGQVVAAEDNLAEPVVEVVEKDLDTAPVADTVVEPVPVEEEPITDDVQLHEGPLGVIMQGNKPLPSILDF